MKNANHEPIAFLTLSSAICPSCASKEEEQENLLAVYSAEELDGEESCTYCHADLI